MSQKNSKIVMITMFRNEAGVIRRMLESCYKYIDYYVIQNNGSTDGTQEIVEDFFKDKNIPGIIYNCEEGWQGFGWNRDHLLQYTQNTNHGCDWILKMDCDEVLEVDADFDWSPLDNHNIQSFHITAIMGSSIYYRAWMWNAKLKWAFNHDPCHETIYLDDGVTGESFQRYDLPNKIRQIGYPQGQSWSNPTKFISDALILEEKMIKENSFHTDLYHFWYIGKSYMDAYQMPTFPLGDSQQQEFAKRAIYYFTEYLNVTHNFSETRQPNGIHEMGYLALTFTGDTYRYLGDIESAIECYTLAEPFAPPRNEHLFGLAVAYNSLQDFESMRKYTSQLIQPDRKNPFPNYHLIIDSSIYVDGGNRVQELHNIAVQNTSTKPSTFTFSKNSQKKIFVVDNFYENPDAVRQFALAQEFQADIRYYKGLRTPRPYRFPGMKEQLESIIGESINNWEEHGYNGCFQICNAQDPQVYHHDMQKWAAMIYLSPNPALDSGTRLLRSKINGASHISDPGLNQAFSGGFYDSTKFDITDSVGNIYNRLIVMDAQSIHSAGPYFGRGKEDGRLTHLFFFD